MWPIWLHFIAFNSSSPGENGRHFADIFKYIFLNEHIWIFHWSLLTHICVTRPQWINPLWASDTIWRRKSRWTCVQVMACKDHSGYGLSPWETTLQCNVVSHWLSPYPLPVWHQTIIWTNVDLLSAGYLGTTVSIKFENEIITIFIHDNTSENVVCKMSPSFSRWNTVAFSK